MPRHVCPGPIQRLPVRGSDTVDFPSSVASAARMSSKLAGSERYMSPLEKLSSTTVFRFDTGNRCSDWITLVGLTARYVQSFQDRSGGSGLFFQKADEEP